MKLMKALWFTLLASALTACAISPPPQHEPVAIPLAQAEHQSESDQKRERQARLRVRQQSEIERLCHELGRKLGSVSIAGCLQQKLQHSGYYSGQGRALVFRDFSAGQNAKARVLVIGGIHGDEYSSFSMLFRWLEKLSEQAQTAYDWRLIPAANPDGLLGNRPAQRINANGVDLNRNFPTRDWQEKAHVYWQQRTYRDVRRYPGDAAGSEPETQWLQRVLEQWQPDVVISVHAPYALLDFDSPAEMRAQAPKKMGFLHLQPLGTYPGSLGRYVGLEREIPVLTIELPHAGIMPSWQQQAILWRDLQQWVQDKVPFRSSLYLSAPENGL